MPYHAFLDESGQREYGTATDRYYVVAGAIVPIGLIDAYGLELAGLKRAFFGTTEVEIKSNWLRQPAEKASHYLEPYGITASRLAVFVDALYDWIRSSELLFIAGVIDKQQMRRQYVHPHNPSSLGYLVFLQRYQKFLASRHSMGAVTCDEFSGASAAGNPWRGLLVRQHRVLRRSGCPYTRLRFLNIERRIGFQNSSSAPLIQVADLAAYNVFRQFRDHGSVWDAPDAKQLPLYRYFCLMLPRFHQSPTGVFAGFGVAKMPTRTIHRWLAK